MLWPRTKLCDLLGIEHPILQAPIAGSTTLALLAAVSNACGLGGHGCATLSAGAFKEHVCQIRAASNRPFDVNFFNHVAPPKDGEARPLMRATLQGLWDEARLGTVPAADTPGLSSRQKGCQPFWKYAQGSPYSISACLNQ